MKYRRWVGETLGGPVKAVHKFRNEVQHLVAPTLMQRPGAFSSLCYLPLLPGCDFTAATDKCCPIPYTHLSPLWPRLHALQHLAIMLGLSSKQRPTAISSLSQLSLPQASTSPLALLLPLRNIVGCSRCKSLRGQCDCPGLQQHLPLNHSPTIFLLLLKGLGNIQYLRQLMLVPDLLSASYHASFWKPCAVWRLRLWKHRQSLSDPELKILPAKIWAGVLALSGETSFSALKLKLLCG